jgi:hypothetical protein
MLEKFASLTMNSQAGIFIFLMFLASRKCDALPIPLPMHPCFRYVFWTIPVFFNSAVLLDIYNTARDLAEVVSVSPVNISSFITGLANMAFNGDEPVINTTLRTVVMTPALVDEESIV